MKTPREQFAELLDEYRRGGSFRLHVRFLADQETILFEGLRAQGVVIDEEPSDIPPRPIGTDATAYFGWAKRLAALLASGLSQLDDGARHTLLEEMRSAADSADAERNQILKVTHSRLRELAKECSVAPCEGYRRVERFDSSRHSPLVRHAIAEVTALDFQRSGIPVEVREIDGAFETWAACDRLDLDIVAFRSMPWCEFLNECRIRGVDLVQAFRFQDTNEPEPIKLGVVVPFVPAS